MPKEPLRSPKEAIRTTYEHGARDSSKVSDIAAGRVSQQRGARRRSGARVAAAGRVSQQQGTCRSGSCA